MRIYRSTVLLCLLSCALPTTSHGQNTDPGPLAYVPESTVVMISARPSRLLRHRVVQPMAEELNGFATAAGFDLSNLESWTFVVANDPGQQPAAMQIMRTEKPGNFDTAINSLVGRYRPASHAGVEYMLGSRAAFLRVSPTMIVLAETQAAMHIAIDAGAGGGLDESVRAKLDPVRNSPFHGFVNFRNLRELTNDERDPEFKAVSKLWQESELGTFQLNTEKTIELNIEIASETREAAAVVAGAAKVGATLGTAQLGMLVAQVEAQMKEFDARGGDVPEQYIDEMRMVSKVLNLAGHALGSTVIEQKERLVTGRMSVGAVRVGRLSGQLAPVLRRQWWSVIRAQRIRNLREIAVAMHNYHDTYRRFPASAQKGKDGEGQFPVSWRVLLLPYLDETVMYNEYRFDEPWNSPHNAKVTSRLPDVYRAAGAPGNTLFSSYFVVVGAGAARTCFGQTEGTKIADIIDGTSNTLMVVEARRDTHWAEPEDITYDPAGKLPKLGGFADGGFRFARADGSVGYIAHTANEVEIRNFLTRNDARPLDQSIFTDEPIPEGVTPPEGSGARRSISVPK